MKCTAKIMGKSLQSFPFCHGEGLMRVDYLISLINHPVDRQGNGGGGGGIQADAWGWLISLLVDNYRPFSLMLLACLT